MTAAWSLSRFPADWLTTATVTRGGRDQAGNVTDPETFVLDPVMVGWVSTADSPDWEGSPDEVAVLMLNRGQAAQGATEPFRFRPKDIVDIPDGPWPSGKWRVGGDTQAGQLGTMVQLRKVA